MSNHPTTQDKFDKATEGATHKELDIPFLGYDPNEDQERNQNQRRTDQGRKEGDAITRKKEKDNLGINETIQQTHHHPHHHDYVEGEIHKPFVCP